MDIDKLRAELKKDEGIRLRAYPCSAGHMTIGYGHNLSARGQEKTKSCTLIQAQVWLEKDMAEAIEIARFTFKNFETMTDARQRVLVNMCFVMGWNVKKEFTMLCRAVSLGHWEEASKEILDSKFARQTGLRARRLADMMREG